MVYQILHQAHLKEVGLTQYRETKTLQNLTTVYLLLTYCVDGPHIDRMVRKWHFVESPVEDVFTLQFEGPWPHKNSISNFHGRAFR